MRVVGIAIATALAVVTSACILKTTRHTIYLEPDGSLTWTVLEEDVHSDSNEPADREREECEWLTAAGAADQGMARALAALGGEPTTRVLRDRRPFAVWTEARFGSVEQVIHTLVDRLRLPATVATESSPDGGSFVVELDLASAEDIPETDSDEPLFDLFDGLEDAQVALVEGRFTLAEGFTLDEKGRVARPMTPPADLIENRQGTLRWALRWTTANAADESPPTPSPTVN